MTNLFQLDEDEQAVNYAQIQKLDLNEQETRFFKQLHQVPTDTLTRMSDYREKLAESVESLKNYQVSKDQFKLPADLQAANDEKDAATQLVNTTRVEREKCKKAFKDQQGKKTEEIGQQKNLIAQQKEQIAAIKLKISEAEAKNAAITQKENELMMTATPLQKFTRNVKMMKPIDQSCDIYIKHIQDFTDDLLDQNSVQAINQLNDVMKTLIEDLTFLKALAEIIVGQPVITNQKDEQDTLRKMGGELMTKVWEVQLGQQIGDCIMGRVAKVKESFGYVLNKKKALFQGDTCQNQLEMLVFNIVKRQRQVMVYEKRDENKDSEWIVALK